MGIERNQENHKDPLRQVKEDVKKIRPILEKDPDWNIASSKQSWNDPEEYKRRKRAITRLTKKAVTLLFPEYKVQVRRDRGTAHNWVDVNFIIPKEKVESLSSLHAITSRTQALLESVGIQYASYYSDFGPGDDYFPCLNVSVNHIC